MDVPLPFPRQETPSFARRDNVTHQPAQKAERGTSGAFCGQLDALVSCLVFMWLDQLNPREIGLVFSWIPCD
jgi:hypothetical protein